MELGDDRTAGQTVDPAKYAPKTLRTEIDARGRLPASECLDLALALLPALGHLHQHGLVHRDLKPSNVIFVLGRPKLADIGLVASIGEALTAVGTEGYMPPEGRGSPAGDIYSFGKLLYEISTGLNHGTVSQPADSIARVRRCPAHCRAQQSHLDGLRSQTAQAVSVSE